MMNPPASAPGSVARVVYPTIAGPGSDRAAARDADDVRAEARGHAAGYAAGLRAAELELAARRAALEAEHAELHERLMAHGIAAADILVTAARALDARVVQSVSDAEEVLVATAFDLAEAVVGYELRASEPSADEPSVDEPATPGDPDPRAGRTARAAVARALVGADGSVVTTLRLHPLDLALLDESTRASSAPGVVFAADPSLGRGDAEADLPAGLIDARLDTALARARQALLGAPATVTASTTGAAS
ncbi:hypothetical protein SOM11_05215 [Frigoribacterium sp. CFBP9039]|uniref:FliH/SctL family protein n=1 Tax=Frigoribacterium sp. CFBP9029 TaxID=3096541 RepID=UPI002A6B0589|nr:hypothetical protein [Frigoribacterium sp. CFBP9039]MDY0945382.1 hypothetical protein [Frigoribacterium sp. CFBP9039]